MGIERRRLVRTFSETVGEERAETLVSKATTAVGVSERRELSTEEAMDVADHIASADDTDSLVRVSANTLKTRIRTDGIGS